MNTDLEDPLCGKLPYAYLRGMAAASRETAEAVADLMYGSMRGGKGGGGRESDYRLPSLYELQAIKRQSTGSQAGPIVLGPAPGALERLAIRDRVLGLRADVDAVRVLLVLDLLNPGDVVRELLRDICHGICSLHQSVHGQGTITLLRFF